MKKTTNKLNAHKKFIATAISATVASTIVTPVITFADFSDVKTGSFYEEAVKTLSAKGVLGGYPDGTFKPGKSVTRAEAAKMIAYDLGLAMTDHEATTKFTDVKKGEWYYHPILALEKAGLIGGYEDGSFKPNETITRAEMASLLVKAYEVKNKENENNMPFKDVKSGEWFALAVETLYNNNITSGRAVDQYAPKGEVTRGEAAAFIDKTRKAIEEANNPNEPVDENIIESVTDEAIVIDGVSYSFAESVKGLLNANNAAILENAVMKFEDKAGVIEKITFLQINASGQASDTAEEFANNLVLDGHNYTIEGNLEINGNYITVKNLIVAGNLVITENLENDFYSEKLTVKGETTVKGGDDNTVVFKDGNLAVVNVQKEGVRIESKGNTTVQEFSVSKNAVLSVDEKAVITKVTVNDGAKQVEINGAVDSLEVNSKEQATVKGNTTIKEVKVKEGTNIVLESKGKIEKVTAEKGAKLNIGKDASVKDLQLPVNVKADEVISNYETAKKQFENVNGTTNPDYEAPSNPGGGGGGGSTTDPKVDKTIPALDDVTLTNGANGNLVLTVSTSDAGENWASLEIDHSLQGLLPEFTLDTTAEYVVAYDAEDPKAVFNGTKYTYANGVWTIEFNEYTTEAIRAHAENVTFYTAITDKAGNKFGDMYNVTPEMTKVVTVPEAPVDTTMPALDDVTLTNGANGNLVLTVSTSDEGKNWSSLEIDHSLQGLLPEFTLDTTAEYVVEYDAEDPKAVFNGTKYTYANGVWTIEFNEYTTEAIRAHAENVTFYTAITDAAGNKFGDMYNVTPDMTKVVTVPEAPVDTTMPALDDVTLTNGANGNLVLTVSTTDAGENWASLEIDHSLQGLLPEFTLDTTAEYVVAYDAEDPKAVFNGTKYTYANGVWTVEFNEYTTEAIRAQAENVTFYTAITDAAGNKFGDMYNVTPDMTKVVTVPEAPVDTTMPALDDVTLTNGANGNLVLTVSTSDEGKNWSSLEIDHSLQGLLPEFTLDTTAEYVVAYDVEDPKAVFNGTKYTYANGVWTVEFNEYTTEAIRAQAENVTFYTAITDKAGNKFGDMYNVTPEMTKVVAVPAVDEGEQSFATTVSFGDNFTIENGLVKFI